MEKDLKTGRGITALTEALSKEQSGKDQCFTHE
jgi:hypothetical protein